MTVAGVSQTASLGRRVRRYFRDYGGWSGVVKSPLFWVAVLIAGINYDWWLKHSWIASTQSLIPSLLGFSLGTYAILFSLMTNRLKRALKAVVNDRGVPYLNEINATFFHFIFVQVLALAWSFIQQGNLIVDILGERLARGSIGTILRVLDGAASFIGAFLLLYSVLLVVAAALAVYRIASIVDRGVSE